MEAIQLNTYMDGNYYLKEAFNVLAANIRFSGPDIKAITVTSCYENEGKSSILIQLAKHLTENGRRVLVVDADLRKSSVAIRFAPGSSPKGLSEYISGLASLEEIIYPTSEERLSMIFAGACPPNPVSLLGHIRFKELINNMREQYDYVLIDTPPVIPIIDPVLVSAVSDGVVLVVNRGVVRKKHLLAAKAQIEKGGSTIIGTVLNESKHIQEKRSLKNFIKRLFQKRNSN